MKEFFVDLHIHIGSNNEGKPVKITASRKLTFASIVKECLNRKGIDIIGIVDCVSPRVIKDIKELIKDEEIMELPDGGLRHRDRVTILLGAEIETTEENGGKSHHIAFFPFLKQIIEFSKVMSRYITNIDLSSQQSGISALQFLNIIRSMGGVLIPAHVFTPHKSIFGNCARRLVDVFPSESFENIPALELGLSSDTFLADRIGELSIFSFISNSDAHSLNKIGREYNKVLLEKPTFKELMLSLYRRGDRKIIANYGLDPKLGKYHRTHCLACGFTAQIDPPVLECLNCKSDKVVRGVLDRIVSIQDYFEPLHPVHRPHYFYQIPLEFIPKIGRVTLDKLIHTFGSEMDVLHRIDYEDLKDIVGREIAKYIILAREGRLYLEAGGGGKYGKVKGGKENIEQLDLF
ncbi:MAG TPA: endonuclease Q family protein [Candidatus Eremiobacteraeota bacterium]|nr:endonuclease Q family protein [Candidatus Eremiobacteraeota bacterium]